MKPKYYDEIQKLRLIDDELMGLCFNNNIEAAELLVRVILGRDDLKIISAKTQAVMKGLMREVRLDVLAVDTEGRKYNIEFQRKNKGAEPERARLNASMIDANSLDKGEDFTKSRRKAPSFSYGDIRRNRLYFHHHEDVLL